MHSPCTQHAHHMVLDRGELYRKVPQRLLHVDCVTSGVPLHQAGKRLLHGIGGCGALLLQDRLRDMLHLERLPPSSSKIRTTSSGLRASGPPSSRVALRAAGLSRLSTANWAASAKEIQLMGFWPKP